MKSFIRFIPMAITLKRRGLACTASVGLLALTASAAPVSGILNGSFEETTAPAWDYWGPGTFAPAASWIDLTATGNAGSLSSGLESIAATAGTRLLRLATEANGINGRYAQLLGTMVSGETYTFRADVIASNSSDNFGPTKAYKAQAAFVNEAAATPATVYATQTLSVPLGETGGFILSYTATAPDDGLDLYIWLQAESVDGAGTITRGGIDRARLDGQPVMPDTPSSPSPANGAGIAGVSPTLTWSNDPVATSYQVSLWPVGGEVTTVDTSDPTWTPGELQVATVYQWQVVAVNANGSTPGPVWSFTTGVIPFTYIYEPDSAPPNAPAELANPYMLNDGLIGTGWDALTQLYSLPPYAYPVPKIPYVTLTLASNPGVDRLTVWYTRFIDAGIAEPISVTVTDEFAHSITVAFMPQTSNGVFSQDVSLAGMQGTVLHLNFTSKREWVGLDEIRVFEPAPLPPAAPTVPVPLDGNIAVPVTTSLEWNVSVGATSYDVYLWSPPETQPLTPSSTATTNRWTPTAISASEATYNWRVVAKNAHGSTEGAVWTFTTSIFPYNYVYEADGVQPGEPELSTPHALNDGVVGTDWGFLYMTGASLTGTPHIKLTFSSPPDNQGKLTVWYTRAVAAGIYVPASVTVSDDFDHSITTTFAAPTASDGVFSQDVALTGMQGTILHLNFASTLSGSWLGLNEIKVFEAAALPPELPIGPVPSDGNVNVSISTSLGWNACVGATGYDVYLWSPPEAKPLTPTASVTTNRWTPTGIGTSEASYNWQVVAQNAHGSAEGAVWTFTTSLFPYSYTYDDESARPENYGGGYGETRATPQFLNDGRTGGGWAGGGLVLYYGNDYLGNPAAYWPAVSLTLAQAPGFYQALRIWHYGGGGGGVHAPASLTVTDDFGHSTTFADFPDAVPTSTDVPIPDMQGTNLHLRFGPNGESVGLSEIKVLGTAAGGSGYDTWAGLHAGSQPAGLDYDHDGVPNGIEYFMDAPDGFTENPGVVAGKVAWSRVNPVASFEVQVSNNLTDWSPANPADVNMSDPSRVIYTFPGATTRQFCRLAVTP